MLKRCNGSKQSTYICSIQNEKIKVMKRKDKQTEFTLARVTKDNILLTIIYVIVATNFKEDWIGFTIAYFVMISITWIIYYTENYVDKHEIDFEKMDAEYLEEVKELDALNKKLEQIKKR